MTQNTEQNVRTRDEQSADLTNLFGEEGTFTFVDDRDAATKHILEAEARGAEEQRRKDAEEQEAVAWLIQDKSKGKPGRAYSPDRAVTDKAHADKAARFNSNVSALYTCPANVAALEARIAELVEAEQLARADAEASKANAGWNFLTENVSSDPELPSCRLSTLFQEGDELSRFQRAAQEFGIEIRLVTDDREDEDCDKELSAEILSKFDSCEFLIRDGWSFVDVWENDDGGIIRLFARAALTREGGV